MARATASPEDATGQDITGVPTVDTLVAQHLIKAISAARLMGADSIINDIRPQVAQTIVQLGLDLNVASKATSRVAAGVLAPFLLEPYTGSPEVFLEHCWSWL